MRIRLFAAAALAGSVAIGQPCLTGWNITASPPASNGTYGCGETVTFCITITNWNQTNANWFHGIVATFGPGWNMATLVPGPPPPTCSATLGQWGWYNVVQGTAFTNIGPTGPGFFFDNPPDGNPGNNYGDNCGGAVNWQFCWTITTVTGPACVNGLSLNVTFNPLSDSQTGSWGSAGCFNDPNPVFNATLQACTVNAGTGGALSLCSTSPVTNLFTILGGTPNPGGTWTGPGGVASTGLFNPATDPPGAYTYTVSSVSPPCSAQAVITVSVTQQPSAGTNGTITVCSSDAPVPLFGQLGGTPTAGGVWTAPGGGAFSGTFNPASNAPGVYTYSFAATPPCSAASATVTVSVSPAANPGTNGSAAFCSNSAAASLFNALGGTPDAGGTWTAPGGVPFSGTYNPAVNAPGVYTYTVTGTAPCPNASATVTVTESVQPNAGTNGNAALCATAPPAALIGFLGGTPDPGGVWTGPGGGAVGGTIDPATAASGVYTYTVNGTPPCTNASATVNVTIVQQPSAGTNGSVNLCTTSAPVDLFSYLGGNPDPGGAWTGPTGQPASATFNPATGTPGAYTYTTSAPAPCVNVSATVTVSVVAQPNAGNNANLAVCSNSAPTPLFPLLGANAQPGGQWTGPGGQPAPANYDPASMAPGVYTYTVTAAPPCGSASATVTVAEWPAPNAGTGGQVTLCENQTPIDPSTWLGGNPDPGGTWTAPSGAVITTVDPGTAASGNYTYTVAGTPPCTNATATVSVTISTLPNAGSDAVLSVCDYAPAVSLFAQLGGGAQVGGTWTGPTGPSNGTFNPASSAPGVYTYTVAGTGGCAGITDQATVTTTVFPAPVPSFTFEPAQGCSPLQVQFTNTTPGTASAAWTFGDGAQSGGTTTVWNTYVNPGTYNVSLQVTDVNGCSASITTPGAVFVSGGPPALFSVDPLRVSVDYPMVDVFHQPQPGITYAWTVDGNPVQGSGSFTYQIAPPDLGPHPFCLTATDALGCSNTTCINVVVDDELTVFVPNAFSPNGDGINDVFFPSVLGADPDKYDLTIFDRWGQEVFRTAKPTEGWNGAYNNSGEILAQGVYVWRLTARDQFSTMRREIFGMVTLLK